MAQKELPQTALRRERKPPRTDWLSALVLLGPFLIVYLMFFIYPALRSVQISFTNSDLVSEGGWVGLANYVKLVRDHDFWASLLHTGYFVLLTVLTIPAVGLLMALMLHRLKWSRPWVQAAFFLPYLLPVSVTVLVWRWVLNPNIGVFNDVTGLQTAWFNDFTWTMPAIAFVTLWWTVGFNMILFLAGLSNISKELYEAAQLDGASGGQVFWRITWPLLWPVTALVLVLQIIASLKIFAQVYLLSNGAPFDSTRVVLLYMYQTAFQNSDAGYASAIATAFFIILIALTPLLSAIRRTA